MPNSEVKPLSADGSVGSPHARVGHRQAPLPTPSQQWLGVLAFSRWLSVTVWYKSLSIRAGETIEVSLLWNS